MAKADAFDDVSDWFTDVADIIGDFFDDLFGKN
jgi:hypothetical protein